MPRNKAEGLLRALRAILPGAEISVICERPWHSLTFSGVQICCSVILQVGHGAGKAATFTRDLPEHEFDLPGQLVADIAVVDGAPAAAGHRLMIDALVLDD
jgi:hypothetical protein